ncbi:MAG: hypothetical protein HGA50_13885, partial [Deltaproteobacteria bacterium]|nr:hypothetical protein [Deltaproteobacteria bacterium]
MRRIFFLCVLGTFLVPTSGSSFDHEDTHRELTSRGILSSSVDAYLKANLNLPQGILTEMGDNSVGKLPHEPPSNLGNWLREGSYLEDELHPCRAINHFHNPRRDWTESGMRDQPWFVDARCTATEYPPWSTRSAIPWATDYTEPSPNGAREETTNQWNWDRAREYFNIYLTGKNYANQGVAITESARDSYLASSFQALGQVLHLLQDMAVPAHVRDDFRSHLEVNGITPSTIAEGNVWIERFEYFVMKKPGIISGDPVRPNLQNPSLTSFWDTNQYTGQDPEVLNSRTLGLAEYANINFPSKNTIFTEDYLADSDPANDVYYHPYPRKSSTNINDFLAMSLLPVMVTAEDGISDSRFYITKSGDGEVIEHFLGAGFFARHVLAVPNYNPRILSMTLERDDECLRNHAEKLLPRAVGYSAALLNYFFRGKIEITETRFGYNPTTRTMDTLTLRAWNVTENAE